MKPHKANGKAAKKSRQERAKKRAEANDNNTKMLNEIFGKEGEQNASA